MIQSTILSEQYLSGIVDGVPVLDLNYEQDSKASTDLNVVMTENGGFIEIQGTAEKTRTLKGA